MAIKCFRIYARYGGEQPNFDGLENVDAVERAVHPEIGNCVLIEVVAPRDYYKVRFERAREEVLSQPMPSAYRTVLVLTECGGGMTNTGFADVVCGPDGRKLKPKRLGSLANGMHAEFERVEALMVTFEHRRGDGEGLVEYVSVDRAQPLCLGLIRVPVYRFRVLDSELGDVEELKRGFKFPERAVRAAIAKACTYHCRNPLYVDADVQPRPDGPRNKIAPRMPIGYRTPGGDA